MSSVVVALTGILRSSLCVPPVQMELLVAYGEYLSRYLSIQGSFLMANGASIQAGETSLPPVPEF